MAVYHGKYYFCFLACKLHTKATQDGVYEVNSDILIRFPAGARRRWKVGQVDGTTNSNMHTYYSSAQFSYQKMTTATSGNCSNILKRMSRDDDDDGDDDTMVMTR